jgi:chromosome segregation ATPase
MGTGTLGPGDLKGLFDIGALTERVKQNTTRIEANHDTTAALREGLAGQKIQIEVMAKEVEEARADIKEAKEGLERKIDTQSINTDKKFDGLTTAARWATGGLLTLNGILVALLAKGI